MKELTIEKINELFDFLTGESVPSEIFLKSIDMPKLSKRKSFTVIYFLQEHLRIIPDKFEMCCSCKELFDISDGGIYMEKTGRCYCECCRPDL